MQPTIAVINDDTDFLSLMFDLLSQELDCKVRLNPPVIVCSAAIHQLRDQQERLEELGIDVLPKPFDLDMLLHKVRSGLARESG